MHNEGFIMLQIRLYAHVVVQYLFARIIACADHSHVLPICFSPQRISRQNMMCGRPPKGLRTDSLGWVRNFASALLLEMARKWAFRTV